MLTAMVWGIVVGVVALAMVVGFVRARWLRGVRLWPSRERLALWKSTAALRRLFWLALPLLLMLCAIATLDAQGRNAGPLWAAFFASLIVQATMAGVFGLKADPASSIALGACLVIELFVAGGVLLFVVLDFSDYFAAYVIGGIFAIVAGIIFAAARSHWNSG